MGSFKQLPKDVVWLILKQVIIDYLNGTFLHDIPVDLISFEVKGPMGYEMRKLACVSKLFLSLVQTKTTHSTATIWRFNKKF